MADIFDKIVVGINKGVSTIGANSKAMIERAKINTAIDTLEKERALKINQLGYAIYEKHRDSGDISLDEITSALAEITACDTKIAEQKDMLLKMEEEAKKEPEPVAAEAGVCTCGHNNKPEAKFCSKCGSKLGGE